MDIYNSSIYGPPDFPISGNGGTIYDAGHRDTHERGYPEIPGIKTVMTGIVDLAHVTPITVPAGAYTQAGAQALVTALESDMNTIIDKLNAVMASLRNT